MLVMPTAAYAQDAAAPAATQEAAPPADVPPADDDAAIDASGEVTVLGRFIPQPMQQTSEVATFLSAEDLSRQGDDNAALALTRLTGLSVVQGRFVYVRGLGDRYSSALLNGSPLPSPEPLRRQVPLDLFPSNILDGATVQKTFSPNYPGEFGGGIIDLRTLRLPSAPFLTLKVGTDGNTESTDKRGVFYYGEDSDWSGIADGARDIPGPLAAAIGTGRRINSTNFTGAQLETIGESLTNSPLTVVQSGPLDPDFEGEATMGTSLDLDNGANVGLVGVIGYDSSWRTRRAKRIGVQGDALQTDFDAVSSAWDIVFNLFGSASYSTEDHEIALTGLLVRSSTKDTELEDGCDVDVDPACATSIHNETTSWYERQLASVQLSGEHTFGALEIDWRTAFAQSTRDAPYERGITYFVVNGAASYPGTADANITRFSELTDEVLSGGVDGAYTIPLSEERDLVLSAGAAYSNSVRDYSLLSFAFRNAITQIPSDVLKARPDFLFSPDNIDPFRFEITEFTGRDDAYKARLTNMAAYVAADIDILPLVRASVGVRYEDASQLVRTGNRFGETPFAAPVTLANTYWLPAATLTWNFAEDLQLRLGYSQTIARPQFRELAFTPYVDPETDRIYEGNPYLVDSEFQNYDARLEWYFGRGQFITGGVFYKQIENPIEEVLIKADRVKTRFLNAPEAVLYGAEAEYRTTFAMPFELPFLGGAEWIFGVNYTYTFSEVQADAGALVVNPTVLPNLTFVPASQFQLDGSQLQGTPKHIGNVQFGFQTDATQMTLLVGYVSERISRRGLGGLPTVYEDPGVNVDLTFRQDFAVGGSTISLGLSGRNLADIDHKEYQLSPTLGETDFNTYARGRSFSASLTAKF
ncbi:MAG: TonB-dependent receptor [Hyphomonadaceae bacterium]|nr:TonB-dependent receptor [Hyphomonadaceae bacterium]